MSLKISNKKYIDDYQITNIIIYIMLVVLIIGIIYLF